MKRIFIFLNFLIFVNISYSQSNNSDTIFIDIADSISKKLSKDIIENGKEIKNAIKDDTLSIKISLILNNSAISEFSIKTNKFLPSKLERQLYNSQIIGRFDGFSVQDKNIKSPDDDYNSKFFLNWKFMFTDSALRFYNIELIPKNSNASIPLDDIKYNLKGKKFNINFMPLNQNFLNIIELSSSKKQIFNSISVKDRSGTYVSRIENDKITYRNIKPLEKYYITLNLRQSAYIYLLSYSEEEEDMNLIYPFLASEKKILPRGETTIGPILFENLKRIYTFKILLSTKEIPIFNYSEDIEIVKGVKIKVIDSNSANKLFKYLNKENFIENMQTETIIFQVVKKN